MYPLKVKKFLRNYDKDLARIRERLDIEDDEDVLQSANTVLENDPLFRVDPEVIESGVKVGFVDSIRASRSRTACCLFLVIITGNGCFSLQSTHIDLKFSRSSVIVIVILIFAHQEFGVIEEKHHHHVSTRHARRFRHSKDTN